MDVESPLVDSNIVQASAATMDHLHSDITTTALAPHIPELSASTQRLSTSQPMKSWFQVGSFCHLA
jgi:hypothetical protein